MQRIVRFFLIPVIVLLFLAILGFYWTFYDAEPSASGTLVLSGLTQPVSLTYDEYGVPHIHAKTEHDAYFAMGYVHARDRRWQLFLTQLAAEGRFAEFFGDELRSLDAYMRTIGFMRMAEANYALLDEHQKNLLQAYANGINGFKSAHPRGLPIQFSLAKVDPIPFKPEHSMAILRLLGWELNTGWMAEWVLAHAKEKLPPAALQQLFPTWNKEHSPALLSPYQYQSQLLDEAIKHELQLRSFNERVGSGVGSNGWALRKERTTTGAALLAGDPHLGLSLPSKWYEVHLSINDRSISGATTPGVPYVLLGQSAHHAWTITSMSDDNTDFFVEQLSPTDSNAYLKEIINGQAVYAPMQLDRSLIKTTSGAEYLHVVRKTASGVLLDGIHPFHALHKDRPISVFWSGFIPSDELTPLYTLNWAQDFSTVQSAVSQLSVPGLSIIYADVNNNIARFTAGAYYERSDPRIVFREAWNPRHRWGKRIPFEQLPHEINPPSGVVANANNNVVPSSSTMYLSSFWEPASRYQRIVALLNERDLHSVEDMMHYQNDTYSVWARSVMQRVLPVLESAQGIPEIAKVTPYLRNWDFRFDKTATAATIHDEFIMRLTRNVLADELGEAYDAFIQFEAQPIRIMDQLLNSNSDFFDNKTTEVNETKEDIILMSMIETVQHLTKTLGDEAYEWRWEMLHKLTLKAPFFSQAAESDVAPSALKLIVNRILNKGPYAVVGHAMSLNNGQYQWNKPYEMTLGPSIRRIVDFASPNSSLSVLPGGQTERPLSSHYDDQIELWLQGRYKTISTDWREINQANLPPLLLQPAK